MFHSTATLHFNPRGDCVGIAVELRAAGSFERVACVVAEPGPFDDFDTTYSETYQRAVRSLTGEHQGQQSLLSQDHPRLHLRRSTDPHGQPPM